MPIDEDNLISKINQLAGLESTTTQALNRISNTKQSLQKIIVEGTQMPYDEDTGQTMTTARRQEIYDKCIAMANELLGTIEED